MDAMKQFANETAEKYNELTEYQQDVQQLEALKEKDKRMKNVSLLSQSKSPPCYMSLLIFFSNFFFSQKIVQLQKTIKEHESTICELKETSNVRTPLKVNHGNLNGTPKTPKTPTYCLPGKENLSPIVLSPATGLIRSRLN